VWRIPIELVQKNEGISSFKASKHHMWIQDRRDPKKKWLRMRYYTTCKDIECTIKDSSTQWKVPVTQNKGTKPKDRVEAGPSKKADIPADNTSKVSKHAQALGISPTTKKPRKKETISRAEVKGDDKNRETSRSKEEDTQKKKKKKEAQTSQKKRTGTQEEET
jgi:hypothetical protein